ncbi:phosphatase PAP2 family protein [Tropicibacter sp. R16_0]|uniref:phosphatase PAP2 family protein n=1 Tax=Tropicibacter sp. R16_0 TaxID=2821102 RepID=UPI001ADB69FE|nr:phosphatase PAP2 family protein [Tropicibacter sp. R16_0]MBO9449910.1 phosphatase PAP2 family protein [Tropicibacter sp. R16_0]
MLIRALSAALCASIGALSSPSVVSGDTTDDLESVGDVLQLAIPLAALGVTYAKDDKEGRQQLAKGVGTTFLTIQSLKFLVEKWRPNYSADNSFPSGHTAAAFSGAAFLQTRYGSSYGVPAYLLASFVGYTRVRAEKHFSDDVLAGASIAMLSNWMYATPLDNGIRVIPTVSENAVGLQVSMLTGSNKPAEKKASEPFKPRFRFSFSFGVNSLDRNEVRSPGSTGSQLNLERFDTFSNPTTSSAASFEYFMSDRHEFYAVLNPLEVRDEGSFSNPVRFDGTVYPANTTTAMDYVMNEIRGGYLYNLIPQGRFDLKIGGGLTFQNTYVRLVSGTLDQEVESNDFAPYAGIHASYELTDRLELQLGADGTSFDSVEFLDAVALLSYELTPQWDIGVGIQSFSRKLDAAGLKNRYDATNVFLNVGYSF